LRDARIAGDDHHIIKGEAVAQRECVDRERNGSQGKRSERSLR
jgi:hypothetical protein